MASDKYPSKASARQGFGWSNVLAGLLLFMAHTDAQAQFNFVTNNGAITITGYTGTNRSVVIPNTTNGLPVTAVGDFAFYNKGSVGSVFIPTGVLNVGSNAFAFCTGLTNITMPDSITNLGYGAFYSCSNLTTLTIGGGVRNIGTAAFFRCSFTNITIPNSVTNIGNSAFQSCLRLRSVALGPGVVSIRTLAFFNCTNLNAVVIPNNVTSIGTRAFEQCGLTTAVIGSGITNIDDRMFAECYQLNNVTIPNTVVRIGAYAFNYCRSLTNIAIPESVKSIEAIAFASCTNLISIVIPNSVTNIGQSAFSSSYMITNITLGNSVRTIGQWAFSYCGAANVVIPENVESIASMSFSSTALREISVNPFNRYYSSVDGVLFNKLQTTLVHFPGGRTGGYTIPSGVTNVGDAAFWSCAVSNVVVPKSVKNVSSQAFGSSGSLLAGIYFQGNAPIFNSYAFNYATNSTLYYLPGATGWSSTTLGRRTLRWNPQVQTTNPSFGVRSNIFGFTITGTGGIPVVVEAFSDVGASNRVSLQSGILTNGITFYFSDPEWTNHPARFYRVRAPY